MLRKIIDDGRNAFVVLAKFTDWDAMRGDLGIQQARSKLADTIDSNRSSGLRSDAEAMVKLLVDNNDIRKKGNVTVHHYEPEEILSAIECLPYGGWRIILEELHIHLYG